MTLGFLGTGAITSAMVTGLSSGGDAPHSILLSPRNAATAAELAARFPGVRVAPSNQAVVDGSETVVTAVRPQIAADVLAELRFRPEQHVVSLVSGYSLKKVVGLVAPASHVARAVPLPAAARRRSPTAIYPPDPVTEELFAALGAAFAVETEAEYDALCTATATMAAYFAFTGTAASWLANNGIEAAQARDYIARIFGGLSEAAMEAPDLSFDTLAADHATRGGINEMVVNHLRSHGVFDTFSEVLDAVMRRVSASSR